MNTADALVSAYLKVSDPVGAQNCLAQILEAVPDFAASADPVDQARRWSLEGRIAEASGDRVNAEAKRRQLVGLFNRMKPGGTVTRIAELIAADEAFQAKDLLASKAASLLAMEDAHPTDLVLAVLGLSRLQITLGDVERARKNCQSLAERGYRDGLGDEIARVLAQCGDFETPLRILPKDDLPIPYLLYHQAKAGDIQGAIRAGAALNADISCLDLIGILLVGRLDRYEAIPTIRE